MRCLQKYKSWFGAFAASLGSFLSTVRIHLNRRTEFQLEIFGNRDEEDKNAPNHRERPFIPWSILIYRYD